MIVSAAEKNTGPVTLIGKSDGRACPRLNLEKENPWRIVCANHSCLAEQRKWGGKCQVGWGACVSQSSPSSCLVPLTWTRMKGQEKNVLFRVWNGSFLVQMVPHKYLNDFIGMSAQKGKNLTITLWEMLLWILCKLSKRPETYLKVCVKWPPSPHLILFRWWTQ